MEIASQQIGQTWFPARVTAKTGSGTSARYSWVSLWVESSGNVANMPYQPEGNATTSTFAGVCLTGDDLSVGDEVLARPALGAGGYLYELAPLVPGTGAQWLRVVGNLANGLYPANLATFHASNQTWTYANTTVQIRGGNAETLTNNSHYLGTLANGTSNGTIGNASNSTVYTVTASGNITVTGGAGLLGRVIFSGNLGNAGNVSNLTLNSSGVISNGTGGNLNFSYDVANLAFPLNQRLGLLTVGSSNVAFPVQPADGTGNHGWVSNTTQTFVGNKVFHNNVKINNQAAGHDYFANGYNAVNYGNYIGRELTVVSCTSQPLTWVSQTYCSMNPSNIKFFDNSSNKTVSINHVYAGVLKELQISFNGNSGRFYISNEFGNSTGMLYGIGSANGATGTIGYDAVATGGIVTSLGSTGLSQSVNLMGDDGVTPVTLEFTNGVLTAVY